MTRYRTSLIVLHWATAALVLFAYFAGGNPAKAKSAIDILTTHAHSLAGLGVLALLALRLPLRLLLGVPAELPAPRWQMQASRATHFALYALMALVPLAGWAALTEKGQAYTLLNLVTLPPLPFAHIVGDAHEALANVFIGLAGVHTAAALAHHYLLRDETLKRMLPLKILKR